MRLRGGDLCAVVGLWCGWGSEFGCEEQGNY